MLGIDEKVLCRSPKKIDFNHFATKVPKITSKTFYRKTYVN